MKTATAVARPPDAPSPSHERPERAVDVAIRGVVQGVGFRPFVHRLAIRHAIAGWVRNEAGAVRLVAQGTRSGVAAFLEALRSELPPLARIDTLDVDDVEAAPLEGFRVAGSDLSPVGRLPVSPDVAVCEACEAELRDPANRRHRYPFITCADCGPRFTVIEAMPYDRERSTMRAFAQCPACRREYEDPRDRRYHSETNSCPACGPRVWLEADGRETAEGEAAFAAAGEVLRAGRVLAVRGLGGFHLAADATSADAVRRLRAAKHRDAKPLAIMVRTLADAGRLAFVSAEEAPLLESRERPIVVLRARPEAPLAAEIAPGLGSVGVMLAYTPLHQLLLDAVDGRPLVMTSGNASDEPIATGNAEARLRLAGIADAFLLHDREIVARYDDSLVRVVGDRTVFLRRSRGYAPLPLRLPVPAREPLLAVGPHLKNTFALAQGDDAYVSQHIGDLENVETLEAYRDSLARFQALFRIDPRCVVRDLHPAYLSTRIAADLGLPQLEPVQHHHAHVAAVLGEHGITEKVIGLSFDGTGYGTDARVWGCELLEADLIGFRRLAHLRYAPLPGGDRAARSPWRTLIGYASLDGGDASWAGPALAAVAAQELAVVRQQMRRHVNAPAASSLGRLFDAAAALVGLRTACAYEGQAAMELEALAADGEGEVLPFPVLRNGSDGPELDPIPLLSALAEAKARGVPMAELAASFHASVAAAASDLAIELCGERGLERVALGGGCFQNALLLDGIRRRLEHAGLSVLAPLALGPNDGAISYGQAVVAAARMAY